MIRRITLLQLLPLALERPLRILRNAWLQKQEDHYLMCAGVEAQRAKEAQQNVRYYQKKAAMVRAARSAITGRF